MKPKEYFAQLRAQVDSGGAASKLELAALEAWEAGDRHQASAFLSLQDFIASGGIVGSP